LVRYLCSYGIGAVLLFSGAMKLIEAPDPNVWFTLITALPEFIVLFTLSALPVLEILLALFLFLNVKPQLTTASVFILMLGFFGLSVYGNFAGWEADCGCFGERVASTFDWKMIVRNGVLATMAGYISIKNVRKG
jgi:hypothetical protein